MAATRPDARLSRFHAAVVRRRDDLAAEEALDHLAADQGFAANPRQLEQALPFPPEPR